MELTPEQRSLRSRLAAHASWARTSDRTERTRRAREAFMRRFEDEVDPDRLLSETERLQRAEQAKKAHFARLALRSSLARRVGSERRPGRGD